MHDMHCVPIKQLIFYNHIYSTIHLRTLCILYTQREHPPKFIPHLGSDSGDGVFKRQADQYLPFRIAVYYVRENITNSSTVLPILTDPSGGFQRVINYLQSVLSVIRASGNLYFPSSCAERNSDGQCSRLEPQSCGDHAIVPDEHLEPVMVCDPTCREVGGGVNADYILYVTAVNDGKYSVQCVHAL